MIASVDFPLISLPVVVWHRAPWQLAAKSFSPGFGIVGEGEGDGFALTSVDVPAEVLADDFDDELVLGFVEV